MLSKPDSELARRTHRPPYCCTLCGERAHNRRTCPLRGLALVSEPLWMRALKAMRPGSLR